jgi:muramoyltetrapeptide carboxypeptidase
MLASASMAALASNAALAAGTPAAPRLLKPRALKRGDLVALIAPGGHVDDKLIERSVRNLEDFGLRVRTSANIRAARGNFGGTIAERLDDLHAMFADREVAALWPVRGGSGCAQLLPHIRYGLVRRHPKILVGYSDITALHLGLFRRAGLVSFHGPVASSTFSDYSKANLEAALMRPEAGHVMRLAEENLAKAATEAHYQPRDFSRGVAEGRLVGGNLSVVAALAGTPYAAEFGKRLLFLEDTGEAPYRIDRMLTQLNQSIGFKRAAGVMLGVFTRCEAKDGEASLSLAETIEEHLAPLKVPAASGYSFGHIAHQYTLPVGVRARMDTRERTLTLLEAAVS